MTNNMQQQIERFRTLHKEMHTIIGEIEIESRLSLVCSLFQKLIEAKRVTLFLYNRKHKNFTFAATNTPEETKYNGGVIECDCDELKELTQITLKAVHNKTLTISTEEHSYNLENSETMLIPIPTASGVGALLLGEYENPFEVIDDFEVECIEMTITFLQPVIEQYLHEKELKEKRDFLNLLYTISHKLSTIRDEEELLDTILALIEENLQIDRCSLMILQPDGKTLKIKKAIGMDNIRIEKIKVKVGDGIAGSVAASKKPLLIKDLDSETTQKSKVVNKKSFRTNSLLSVPLLAHGEMIGVINVNNRKDGLPFSESDLELLTTIGIEIAAILDRSYIKLQLKKAQELDRDINRFMV